MEHPITQQMGAAGRSGGSNASGASTACGNSFTDDQQFEEEDNRTRSGLPPVAVKRVEVAPDADPDDICIAENIGFARPMDDAGLVLPASSSPSLVLAKRSRTQRHLPVAVAPKTKDMQTLLAEQRAMKAAHDKSTKEYQELLKGVGQWQSERRRVFDVVLES
jgi:hypothetical protein